jgi:ribonuclease BN (tRNA processing enzyme)
MPDIFVSRRKLIAGSIAAPVLASAGSAKADALNCDTAAEQAKAALKDAKGAKLVILGSGAGPGPGLPRHKTAHLMLSNGAAYVLDCGLGVTDQFARTGVHFRALRSIFITHHHPDHNIEYGPLLVIGWLSHMPLDVRAFGPPPLGQMTEDLLRAYRTTIDFWAEDFKLPPLVKVGVQEVSAAGTFTEDENVKVSAILVNHPPVKPALGYRFDFHDRSFAFSGDTTPLEAVAQMAKGADVLVHEAIMMAQIEAGARRGLADGTLSQEQYEATMAHMRAGHSPPEAVGRIAAEAGVKTLVLSHLGPSSGVTDDEWRAPAAKYFRGEILVAHDMMVV